MKTELKHTKGEWKIFWGNYGTYCSINKDTSCRIATIKISKRGETGNAPIEEAHANALLISAAPDMLEALQHIIRDISPIIYKMPVKKVFSELISLNEGIKAIRKAAGE